MPFYKIEEMETKYSEVGPATAKTVAGDWPQRKTLTGDCEGERVCVD